MTWDGDGFREMLDHIHMVRTSIAGAQNTKLMMRWGKWGDYRQYSLDDRIDHVIMEMDELSEALAIKGPSSIRDEVLDVRNETEFLWDVLELAKA